MTQIQPDENGEFPFLYSCDNKGKMLVWWMEVQGDKFRSHSKKGQDGKVNTTGWTTCKAKNVGKANATTPEEQAISEVENRYTKKLKNHHHLNSKDFNIRHYFEPMLAQKYEATPDALSKFWQTHGAGDIGEEQVVFQPKLDGFRCIITSEGAFTRTGEPVLTVPHILESLSPLFEHAPKTMLDGELYNHEFAHDFNELASILRKQKPTKEQLERSKEVVQFHCYDLPSVPDEDYVERSRCISLLLTKFPTPYVKEVPWYEVGSHAEVKKLMEGFLQSGYEGGMIRIVKGEYEGFTRSKYLLKYKHFVDEEFEIVNIVSGNGSWAEYAKSVTIRLDDGQLCDAGIKGDFAFAKKLLVARDNLIGKEVTVKYFAKTPDGLLRFGVAIKWPTF